jgi:predicted nucleic acid-binding protein
MIILDTNVVSEFMKLQPDENVVKWLYSIPTDEIWTTSITIFEIQFGLGLLPTGKRKSGLVRQFEQALKHDLDGKILNFDEDTAMEAAEFASRYKNAGQGADVVDMQIAGVASIHDATLATRNIKDFRFSGIKLIDPWQFTP